MLWPVPLSVFFVAALCVAALPAHACEEAHASIAVQQTESKAVAEVSAEAASDRGKQPEELNMDQLVDRLKKCDAIGFITKLAIRSDVMDFKKMVDDYKKRNEFDQKCEELRSHFDGLLLKIMALLEGDPQLAEEIYSAKERIWNSFVAVEA